MSCQEGAMPAAAQPHVLLVSCPLQGHVNPLLRLGRRLAARGLLVTFTTVLRGAIHRGDGASAGGVRFEYQLHGDDLDNEDRAMTPDDMLRRVVDVGPATLADLVRRQADAGRPVSCVVNTTFVPWALDVARELGLPGATLWNQSCAVLSLYHHFYNDDAPFPSAADDAPVALPGLPAMSLDELPLMVRPEFAHNLWGQMLRRQLVEVRGRQVPSWVLVNTFHELERDAIEALRARAVAVTPVGPLLDGEPAVADDGHDDGSVMAWLDAQPPCSVVYVAFGSLVDIGRDETAALAEGLASTGRPFLWVVRDDLLRLPESVLAACRGNTGRIIAWCPQGRVLRHGAVGCFVTHCGWNSVTEALAAGVPVVAYPWWSDQFTNAKFLVEEYGVGVRLPAPVKRDALCACVDVVMNGPEAAAIRTRATAWKEEAAAALADGGSSDRGLEAFVDFLRAPVGSRGVDTISSPTKQRSVSSL